MGTKKVFDPEDPEFQRIGEGRTSRHKAPKKKVSVKSGDEAHVQGRRGFRAWIYGTPFWSRLLIFLVTTFVTAFVSRFHDTAGFAVLLLLLLLAELVWFGFATFRRRSFGRSRKGSSSIVARILIFLLVTPIAWPIAFGFGNATAILLVPLSQQEIAEKAARTARAEAQAAADRAQKAAEAEAKKAQADAEAAQKARDDAAARAQSQVDEADKQAADQQKAIEDLKGTKPLAYAAQSCDFVAQAAGVPTSGYVVTDPEGSTLTLSTMSPNDAYGEFIFQCIADKLNFSAPLMLSIGTTNALAGVMNWTENGMDIQWTYHPDNGLNLSILKQTSCFLFICS